MSLDVGFVGAGGIAETHVGSLRKIPEANVVAFADTDSDSAVEAAASVGGAGAYTDFRPMLEENDLDAVYVCVPPFAHGEIELELIRRGIPFFVEKPLGLDRQTPRRVLEALEATDLVTSVGYVMRYRRNARRLRSHLGKEKPVLARGAYLGGTPGTPWWPVKEKSGGQILEQSTHLFDLARWLFGEVRSVYCTARAGLLEEPPGRSVEDASTCALTFADGFICEIASSCAIQQGELSFEVFTRQSRARLEEWRLNLLISRSGQTHRYLSQDDPFLLEDRVFLEAVSAGDASEIQSTYADAVKTQMVTCAANESLESGRPVEP